MLTASTAQGYGASKSTFYPVVIIGAGMGGIGLACNLKRQLGFDQFRIFERQSGIGGTWWINRYPGIACDIPAAFYSFSFRQNPDWRAFFPSGEEILRYQQTVVEEFHLIDKIQLNTDVSLCRWDEVRQKWEITVRRLVPGLGDLSAAERRSRIDADGPSTVYVAEEEVVRCKVLISAVGGLVEPRAWPANVPGLDRFQGEVFHSARWNHDIDLQGKNVVVVGTGCSAAQFVPLLPGSDIGAARVTQVMREPPWVVPRVCPPLGDEKWASWGPWLCRNIPGFMSLLRGIVASMTETCLLSLLFA